MIYVFLADGFEESEALVPIDMLRRADLCVKTVGIGKKTVTGSHKISINCDITENDAVFEGLEGIILPGGMPGTLNLKANGTVNSFIDYAYENNLIIGAICAAPSILGEKGILKDKRAVCYPGFEDKLSGAKVINEAVVRDGDIITAKGAGAVFYFAFSLVSAFKNNKTADEIKNSVCCDF